MGDWREGEKKKKRGSIEMPLGTFSQRLKKKCAQFKLFAVRTLAANLFTYCTAMAAHLGIVSTIL